MENEAQAAATLPATPLQREATREGMTYSPPPPENGSEVDIDVEGEPSAAGRLPQPNQAHSRPRRSRKQTSGIDRDRGAAAGEKAAARRRSRGDGSGLSKKTMLIVSNLEIHRGGSLPTQEELEEMEEEKRLAEEEKLKARTGASATQGEPDLTVRILLLGDSGVGKTSLLHRYSEDKFHPTLISSAGVDFKVRHLNIGGRKVRCQIWDTAGQEKFHVITRAYYRGAHGIALIYDVTDSDSFKNVNYWMANIQTHASNVNMIIVGNKVDLPTREIATRTGQDLAQEFNSPFFEVSAKEGTCVMDAFNVLATAIVKRLDSDSRKMDAVSANPASSRGSSGLWSRNKEHSRSGSATAGDAAAKHHEEGTIALLSEINIY